MITTEVTSIQLDAWKKLYLENKNNLRVNRISGAELNSYFAAKYAPMGNASDEFKRVVVLNAQENGVENPIVETYILKGNIFVGIDLKSGYFQVECDKVDKMIPVWDDLF